MTENDFNSGQGPQGQDEPLSATAMFLRSFETTPAPPRETPEESAIKPLPPAQASSSGPGEFTQMFQAMEPRANVPSAPPAPPAPAPVPQPSPKTEFQT